MSGHQIIVATGHLGNDPDVSAPRTGGLIAKLSIAVTDVWKDRDGERVEHTEWLRAKVFGRNAELAQQYLRKGRLVTITGKIRTEKWQADDGSDRYAQWIYADSVTFHAAGRDDNEPRLAHKGRAAPAEAAAARAGAAPPAPDYSSDDDIAF